MYQRCVALYKLIMLCMSFVIAIGTCQSSVATDAVVGQNAQINKTNDTSAVANQNAQITKKAAKNTKSSSESFSFFQCPLITKYFFPATCVFQFACQVLANRYDLQKFIIRSLVDCFAISSVFYGLELLLCNLSSTIFPAIGYSLSESIMFAIPMQLISCVTNLFFTPLSFENIENIDLMYISLKIFSFPISIAMDCLSSIFMFELAKRMFLNGKLLDKKHLNDVHDDKKNEKSNQAFVSNIINKLYTIICMHITFTLKRSLGTFTVIPFFVTLVRCFALYWAFAQKKLDEVEENPEKADFIDISEPINKALKNNHKSETTDKYKPVGKPKEEHKPKKKKIFADVNIEFGNIEFGWTEESLFTKVADSCFGVARFFGKLFSSTTPPTTTQVQNASLAIQQEQVANVQVQEQISNVQEQKKKFDIEDLENLAKDSDGKIPNDKEILFSEFKKTMDSMQLRQGNLDLVVELFNSLNEKNMKVDIIGGDVIFKMKFGEHGTILVTIWRDGKAVINICFSQGKHHTWKKLFDGVTWEDKDKKGKIHVDKIAEAIKKNVLSYDILKELIINARGKKEWNVSGGNGTLDMTNINEQNRQCNDEIHLKMNDCFFDQIKQASLNGKLLKQDICKIQVYGEQHEKFLKDLTSGCENRKISSLKVTESDSCIKLISDDNSLTASIKLDGTCSIQTSQPQVQETCTNSSSRNEPRKNVDDESAR